MNAHTPAVARAVLIRPLVASDAVAYKALRDEALRTAPDAFTSDYESSVGRDASEYVARFGAPESGQFFLGAFDAAGQLVGCLGCEREQRTKQRHLATLVGMMVAPQAQRQGIGQQLARTDPAGADGHGLQHACRAPVRAGRVPRLGPAAPRHRGGRRGL